MEQTSVQEVIHLCLQTAFIQKRLTKCLFEIRPDITVSMLRREINFINSIHDGSVKIGEIHVNKSNFRDLAEAKIPDSSKADFPDFG